MTKTIHSTQIVSPFGTGYVHEDHTPVPALKDARKQPGALLAIVLTVALFGVTTAAATLSASNRNCSSAPQTWQQNQPSLLMKLPGYYGPGEALF
jgi:hypothetical protein